MGVASATYAEAAVSPSHLDGKTVVLDYKGAQFQTTDESAGRAVSGWVSFASASRGGFSMGSVSPKATRRLLPITRPGKGGTYTYRKTGSSTGVIEVDMGPKYDMVRTITLTFTSANAAVATERMIGGDDGVSIRNIRVTIQ